ncbi:hypothetical protein QBC38DRAFT_476745 [Podospora fimiseda]|uniref:Uncharacterized protein n=1 Tax=Podospora fimiseda TaxID=252190 RepID=A0AAN7BQS6_9PEZI|nr:hypothetical protein QBC38DRAFT_476745 [Podospora fimiseda]
MGFFARDDDGLVKKDDDHRTGKVPPNRATWSAATRGPRSKTLKRLAIAFGVGIFIYLFIQNLPTDVPIRDRRHPTYHSLETQPITATRPGPATKLKPYRKPERPKETKPDSPKTPTAPHDYDGPIMFRKLAHTLQAISSTHGSSPINKNVLFAAASLKSASLLLPMACDMGIEARSYVHFALMGGSDIDIKALRSVNGVDESCQIIFHDARPDYAATSTTSRLGLASSRALYHINNYMHPQTILIDVSGEEEDFFLGSIRKQAPKSGIPIIELPENAHSRLGWITKLDSSSLAAWDKISVDILIHASPGTSGSLTRLLKSLSAADFSAGATPHLTIELPHDVDAGTTEFLKGFHWPPTRALNPTHTRQLTLRHRIPITRLSEEESSVRFLESFWPANPQYSHILVLSPQTQLSRSFFHYLKYVLLEYAYSTTSLIQEWDSRLLGFSLDLPTTSLNASQPFTPPTSTKYTKKKTSGEDSPFLWQSPNSNAMLYLGSKWIELHTLVSKTLELQHTANPPFFSEKEVSKRYPAWLEHALRLTRVRGYWTLYPSKSIASTLATVHNELYRAPEEYERELEKDLITADDKDEVAIGSSSRPILQQTLPPFDEMPLLLWNGNPTDLYNLDAFAADYAFDFRRAVGGCEALATEDLVPRKDIGDLFCVKE